MSHTTTERLGYDQLAHVLKTTPNMRYLSHNVLRCVRAHADEVLADDDDGAQVLRDERQMVPSVVPREEAAFSAPARSPQHRRDGLVEVVVVEVEDGYVTHQGAGEVG